MDFNEKKYTTYLKYIDGPQFRGHMQGKQQRAQRLSPKTSPDTKNDQKVSLSSIIWCE